MNTTIAFQSAHVNDYAMRKAQTLRFTCGAPRSPHLIGDGSRMLFLRSAYGTDTVNSLWMHRFDEDGSGEEILLADPRELLDNTSEESIPAEERARRERARESGSGIVSYSVDTAGTRAAFVLNDALYVCEIPQSSVDDVQLLRVDVQQTPVLNPRISPDGTQIAYSTGTAVVVVNCDGSAQRVVFAVPEEKRDVMRAGIAEFAAAEELDRYDGFWWSPDSTMLLVESFDMSPEPVWTISDPANPTDPGMQRRYPQALTHNAEVKLYVVWLQTTAADADAGAELLTPAEVQWDHEAYEYLAVVRWVSGQLPLLQVLNRLQQDEQVLEVEIPAAGGAVEAVETRVCAEHHNDQWIDCIAGTPTRTPSGQLICAVNDMEHDTNRITLDGQYCTPVGWQIREVLDVDDAGALCIVQRREDMVPQVPAAWQKNASQHDARSYDVVRFGFDGSIEPVSIEPGVWRAARAGSGAGSVLWGRTMDDPHMLMLHAWEGHIARVKNYAEVPDLQMNVHFMRVGEHQLQAAVVLPTNPEYVNAKNLPVLLHPYGGPGFQEVTMNQAAYWDAQWWAEQGYIVLIADGRGTTGRGPIWDREIYQNMKDVSLADQVEAVYSLPLELRYIEGAGTPDMRRVAMIGWSYGGFLSATAVIDAPDVFAAACAGAPPTDWTLYDTCYTERYLGLDPAVYEKNSIIADAEQLEKPLMLIHGFADDNVTIANSLRLSQALMAAGRPHTFLPLSGITHMTNDPVVAQNLLLLQRDFLAQALQ